ncbi:glycogen/starch/alpha-glucan phosphorylase [Pseudomonas syringae group genomosp. 7]|uniref:glycogen/starch/alpha-glucan phosphorylase n=1 Tax=Pseudomonas syringae group genomosp. 7 TaxID=251699 RepID=UPI00376FB091
MFWFVGLFVVLLVFVGFVVCVEFVSFWAALGYVVERWEDSKDWWRSAVLNFAGLGGFSSERTIRESGGDIW